MKTHGADRFKMKRCKLNRNIFNGKQETQKEEIVVNGDRIFWRRETIRRENLSSVQTGVFYALPYLVLLDIKYFCWSETQQLTA